MQKLQITTGVVLALACLTGAAEAAPSLSQRVEAAYRAQKREAGNALVARQAGGGVWSAHKGVRVEAVFHSRAKGLTIRAKRAAGVRGELLVAIPPGTFAQPIRSEDDPWPQDLLLLEARVLRLGPAESSAELTLPVACASFRRQGPSPRFAYRLEQAKVGSNLDRLAQVLCARSRPIQQDPALALALWIAHEQLGYARLRDSAGFHTFRTPRQKVRVEDAPKAARLLRAAGLKLDGFEFFRSAPRALRGEPTPKPAPEPEQPAPGPRRPGPVLEG